MFKNNTINTQYNKLSYIIKDNFNKIKDNYIVKYKDINIINDKNNINIDLYDEEITEKNKKDKTLSEKNTPNNLNDKIITDFYTNKQHSDIEDLKIFILNENNKLKYDINILNNKLDFLLKKNDIICENISEIIKNYNIIVNFYNDYKNNYDPKYNLNIDNILKQIKDDIIVLLSFLKNKQIEKNKIDIIKSNEKNKSDNMFINSIDKLSKIVNDCNDKIMLLSDDINLNKKKINQSKNNYKYNF